MIHIFLVRHGETVWHAENRYAGRSEVGLSDAGKVQARRLARWAKAVGIEILRVSPQLRAMETMRPVAEMLSIDPIVDPRWREIDFGFGEGMTAKEMAEKMPEERRKFDANPVVNPLPGGENPRSAIVRGRTVLHAAVNEAAQSKQPTPRTLVVCHSTLIRLLLCDALGINPSLYRKVFPRLGCGEITELGFSMDATSPPSFASLLRFNVPAEISTSH